MGNMSQTEGKEPKPWRIKGLSRDLMDVHTVASINFERKLSVQLHGLGLSMVKMLGV